MTPNEYQEFTNTTAIYPKEHALVYLCLGLGGEAGEIQEKVKKLIRDKGGLLNNETRESIMLEVSDLCWYIAQLSEYLGYDFEQVLEANVKKLQGRKDRGKLHGSGDNR